MAIKWIPFLSLLAVILYTAQASADDERSMFMDAKKKCISQDWRAAIDLLEEFLDKYPESRNADDAKFWIGYCEERIPGRQSDAFFTYEALVKKYPSSSWVNDARVHQIGLAEEFVRDGKDQYKTFLNSQLQSPERDISSRAAISLGKLGDRHALPVLESLENDEDLGPMATNLTDILRKMPATSVREEETDTTGRDLRLVYKRDLDELSKPAKPQAPPERDEFMWFNTQRYEQYRSMLRKENDWTPAELEDFAMWHIMDNDQFEEYRNLDNEYDRKEWRRKFWKSLDPTPTTDVNELKEEFDRRVIYTRAHFSECWNNTNFRYLPDQHLREGWYHAPWDARGELYIKYGEPDMRSVYGWHTEEWVYYRYGVDFIVKQYMTNIYGNAINAGSMTRAMYKDQEFPYQTNYQVYYPWLSNEDQEYLDWNTWNTYLDANFVYKNEIRYEHNYGGDPIEDFKMDITRNNDKMLIRYSVPAEEFKLNKIENRYRVAYRERITVLDEDMREVYNNDTEREIRDIPDENFEINRNALLDLKPGVYRVSVRIEDTQSPKIGIYSEDIDLTKP
jgi:GWxTD domain-containing protein